MKTLKTTFLFLFSLIMLTACSKNSQDLKSSSKNIREVDISTHDISEPWEVEDEWKLTIDKIYTTEERNHDSDKEEGQTQSTNREPENVYKLQYTYENFDDSKELLLLPEKIVLDTGEEYFNYPLYEINHPFPIEGKGICEKGEVSFSFDYEDSTHIKIYFNKMDKNLNWQKFIYEYDLNDIL